MKSWITRRDFEVSMGRPSRTDSMYLRMKKIARP